MVFRFKESQFVVLACLLGQAIAPLPLSSSAPGGSSASTGTASPLSSSSKTSTSGLKQTTTPASSPAPVTGGIGSSGTIAGHSGCFNFLNQKDGCVSPTGTNNCRPKLTSITIEQFGVDGANPSPSASKVPASSTTVGANLSSATTQKLSPNTVDEKKLVTRQATITVPSVGNALSDSPGVLNANNSTPPGSLTGATGSNTSLLTPASNLSTIPTLSKSSSDSSNVGAGALIGANDMTSNGICGPYNPETDFGVCLWSGEDTTGQDAAKSGWINMAMTTNCNKQVVVFRAGVSQPIVAKVLDGCNFSTTQASLGCSQIYLTKRAFMDLKPSAEEVTNGYFKDALMWDFFSRSNATNAPL